MPKQSYPALEIAVWSQLTYQALENSQGSQSSQEKKEKGANGSESHKHYKMPSQKTELGLILPAAQNNTQRVPLALILPDVVNESFFPMGLKI